MSLDGRGRGRGLLLRARRTRKVRRLRDGAPAGAVRWHEACEPAVRRPTMGAWKCPREAKDRLTWR
jgi:hypothetical protein